MKHPPDNRLRPTGFRSKGSLQPSMVERPIYAFFMILGYSRMRYVEFVTEMTTMTLIRCIENAFTYYGGSTKEVLFDNMPQIVNRCLTTKGGNSLERMLIPEFTAFAGLCRI